MAKLKIMLIGSVSLFGLMQAAQADDIEAEVLLDPIVVSSGKRDQEENKVDQSLTVLSAEEIEDVGATEVEDLQVLVPGLTVGRRGNRAFSNVTMRGLSSPDYYNPSVQLYVDGVPQPYSALSQLINDVEQVEVLRGPQGTLYGANAFAGVINIKTKEPLENTAYIETTLSPQEPGLRAGATLEVLKDKLYLDVSGAFSHFGGDVDNVATGEDDINVSDEASGRVALRYQPTGGDFDAALSYQHQYLSSVEDIYISDEGVDGRDYNSTTMLPDLERTIDSASLSWNRYFGDFTLSGTTAYQETDIDRQFNGGFIWPENEKSLSQELTLSYEGERFDTVGGLWYQHKDFTGHKSGYTNAYGEAVNNVLNDSAAVFGEVTWHATQRFDVTGGLRLGYERASIDANRADTYGTGYGYDFDNDADFWSWQPKLALGYAVTEDLRLYGLVSKGYKPGGFNHNVSSSSDSVAFDPEEAWNFEAGVKSALLDGRAVLRASGYYIASSDKQIYVGPIGAQYIRNVGDARSYGLELEANVEATENLTLSGNLTLGRSEFTSGDYDGKIVPYAPAVLARLQARYLISNDFLGTDLAVSGGANFTSKTYFDESNSASQDAYALFDAALEIGDRDDVSARLYVKNIADESYKTYSYTYNGAENGTLGRGRTFGLTLRKAF